jgi:hypothetical protein
VIAAHAVRRQRFQRAPGDIGAGGVEHGVVIGEGNVVEKLPVVVGVEGRPSAIARLHGQQPVRPPAVAGLLRRGSEAGAWLSASITMAVSSISG